MPEILHRFFVKAPATKIFEAFTSPIGLNNWWTKESSGKPVLNNIYRFYFTKAYDWRAKVIKVTPDKELIWQMTEAMHDWMPTQIGFTLTEENHGTAVYFFHSNWQQANEHFAISNYCWGQLLKGLKDHCETGAVVPFENRN